MRTYTSVAIALALALDRASAPPPNLDLELEFHLIPTNISVCLMIMMSRGSSFSELRGRVPGSMDKGAVILDIGRIYTKY